MPVTIGDFADVEVEGIFSLVFVINNTFLMLTSQEEQIRCFKNVASHLHESGVFLVHTFVPDVSRFDEDQHLRASLPDVDSVRLDVSIHDAVNQVVDFRHLHLTEDGIRMYPGRLRYVWPTELDLMARLAGLRLRERWGRLATCAVHITEWLSRVCLREGKIGKLTERVRVTSGRQRSAATEPWRQARLEMYAQVLPQRDRTAAG